MKALSVLLATLLVCGAIGEDASQRAFLPRQRSQDKVIGGTAISIEEWPSIVSLHRGVLFYSHVCGGNILSNYILVSAAHCFADSTLVTWSNPQRWRVRAGSARHGSGGDYLQLSHVIMHSQYDPRTTDYDIVVLRLATPLSMSPSVAQIAIPPQDSSIADGTPARTAGWGATAMGGGSSTILLAADFQIVNQDECHQAYLDRWGGITDRMICAGWPTGGFDACQGDSGGPLKVNDTLAGIVSWGNGCALAEFPGVNTRTSYFTEWIMATAASF